MATLAVRAISLRDMPSLHDLHSVHVAVGLRCDASTQFASSLLASLPFTGRFRRIFVATLDDRVAALIELDPDQRNYRWLVTRLAASPIVESESGWVGLWSELLVHTVRAAGAAGAKRLHAAPSSEGPAFEALRRAAFTVYSHQTTLLAQGLHLTGTEATGVREQDPSDAWSIHQLYHMATPYPVQHAEALTSNHWDIRRDAARSTRGFLVDSEHQVAAYCRIRSGRQTHMLDVLSLPGEAHLLASLLPEALRRAGVGARDAVWVSVPDYQVDHLSFLEPMGFESIGRQARMVRYTAVPVRTHLVHRLHLVPEVGERLAPRLPSLSSTR